ncbi:MAG: anti-sigma factor antagonist [Ilumatobacteraceae bacterium]|nr:anti-sigma factor antagonist [Ilumatobacteraceae bacterium]
MRMSDQEDDAGDDFEPMVIDPPFSYHRDGAGRIVVVGDIDLASAEAFRPVLLASRDAIDLDLGGVGFMDSSGVKVLLQARRVRPVHIVVASPAVSRVLELLGLTETFVKS